MTILQSWIQILMFRLQNTALPTMHRAITRHMSQTYETARRVLDGEFLDKSGWVGRGWKRVQMRYVVDTSDDQSRLARHRPVRISSRSVNSRSDARSHDLTYLTSVQSANLGRTSAACGTTVIEISFPLGNSILHFF